MKKGHAGLGAAFYAAACGRRGLFLPGREPVPGNFRKVLHKRRQTCVIGMEKINLLNVLTHSL